MYTLEIDENGHEEWVKLYDLEFSLSIFINDSYITHNLRKMKPIIALIDPVSPNIVYFCQDKRIFSIDIDLRVVLSCQPLEMLDWDGAGDWGERYNTVQWSNYFHAWELPSTHCLMAPTNKHEMIWPYKKAISSEEWMDRVKAGMLQVRG